MQASIVKSITSFTSACIMDPKSKSSQVSEAASSALTIEAILQICAFCSKGTDSAEEKAAAECEKNRVLERQGIIVGLRLTERLLYREPFFNGTPTEIARYVGYTMWKVIFGKKVDSIKTIDNMFHLTDQDFRWLQGFPKLKESDRVQTLVTSDEGEGSKEKDAEENAGPISHRDVLFYAVGLIKGAVHPLVGRSNLTVSGTYTKEGETFFVLDFR
jgi:trafficking protein particle complex subunit 6